MSDIVTSVAFSTGETVTAAIMNSIIPSCTIQASFVSAKPLVSTLGNSDAIFGVSASNNLQQILYSNLQAQILSSSVGASQSGVYNLLMNGDGLIIQRNSSVASIAATGYTGFDRWKWQYSGSASRATVAQDVPSTAATLPFVSGGPSSYSDIKITVPSATSTIGATDYQAITQSIENNIVEPICQGPISIGFIYSTNFSGVVSIFLRDNTLAHCYVVPVTLTGDSAWHYVTIQNITGLGSQVLGFGSAGARSIDFGITLLAGSSQQTGTTGAWVAGNFLAANTQGNFMASASNVIQFAQLMICPGATAVPYYSEPFTQQLLKCQRYYVKTYAYGVYSGSASSASEVWYQFVSTSLCTGSVKFPSVMRATPTVTVFNSQTGASGGAQSFPAGTNVTGVTASSPGDNSLGAIASAAAFVSGQSYRCHLIGDSDY